MADETPKTTEMESPAAGPETPAAAQPTQSITVPSVRKRGRPKKVAQSASAAAGSLTRTTTRRVASGKAAPKPKQAPTAPRMTMLNRLVNFSVVIAVFVTALAIQRIVPTEPVNIPKVEALPAPTAAAPIATTPAAIPSAIPATAPAAVPTPAAAEVPKVVATDCVPSAAPASKPAVAAGQITKRSRVAASRATGSLRDHSTSLNSGGSEDLDSEAARQNYMATSKLATRAAAPK